ncbi:hypothetical protein JVT61DRAFT_14205 [Boletus reticuloceps]|uniref:Uncharacterized protein n=1 Tax=Boletus reticuloceps TaxID=495285 RepID=A0A8I3A380_9AGAM|nr:hypothetical protein JVT61DRAFT_14205 [Boletus reticuloceps]
MSQDYSPLALDDLVHLMSPSPAPQTLLDDSDMPPRTKSTSPDPLPESDIVQMRRKVMEICHNDKTDAQLSPREKELVEMVLRLTTIVGPGPDQLLRQAEMVSALIQQRDLLLHQFEEQRLRWNSEKDGWARMAEALLAQQAKNRFSLERDEDFERLHAAEADNKGLRQRLNETQSRLQLLESELTTLRPLLLMQPLISRSSLPLPPPTPNPKTQHARRRKKNAAAMEHEDHVASEDELSGNPHDTSSLTPHSQATPRPKPRRTEVTSNPLTIPHKRRPSQKATSRGLSADARVEHLLLAARRIGKHRAGVMAGMVQHLEERERERKREESATTVVASTPKTPKRNTGYPPEGGYVYLNNQIRPGPGMQPVPMFIPAYPHLLQTPSSSTTAPSVASSAQQSAQKSKQDARTNNPPTPLDSLLCAARSMMRGDIDVEVDEDEEIDVVGDSPGQTPGARQVRPEDMLGSPVPKRRKIAARTDKLTALHESAGRTTDNAFVSSANANGATNAGVGRVRSALDVLADQAAAFSTQEHPATPFETQLPIQAKGKGKERANPQPQEPSSSTPKSRGRPKSRRKEPEVNTPSSVVPTSRSRTPRSDMGDNAAGSVQIRVGGSAPEAQVDPGGGTSSASTSQTLDSTSVSGGNQVRAINDAESPGLSEASLRVDDAADATPGQDPRVQNTLSEEGSGGTHATTAPPNPAQLLVQLMPENERRETSRLPPRAEASLSGGENSGSSSTGTTSSTAPAKNKELIRVTEQVVSALPAKRQRSPYVKWSKEEDDLLAQAVAKYGQKWDLVQKALPSRGYHQVRQRWLRKLGVFDSKPDLSSFQTAATTFSITSRGDDVEPRGNPKLGLAPLSSEKAYSGLVGRPPSLPS